LAIRQVNVNIPVMLIYDFLSLDDWVNSLNNEPNAIANHIQSLKVDAVALENTYNVCI
jgi:hypothetical protein